MRYPVGFLMVILSFTFEKNLKMTPEWSKKIQRNLIEGIKISEYSKTTLNFLNRHADFLKTF